MGWQRTITNGIPLMTIPALLSYGWLRYNKHLYGIYKEKDRLSYNSKEAIPLDESTQKIVDEVLVCVVYEKQK